MNSVLLGNLSIKMKMSVPVVCFEATMKQPSSWQHIFRHKWRHDITLWAEFCVQKQDFLTWSFESKVCIPVGCVPPAHWPYLIVSGGGEPACPGGMWAPGVRARGWGHACTHAPVNRMTDRCKNIWRDRIWFDVFHLCNILLSSICFQQEGAKFHSRYETDQIPKHYTLYEEKVLRVCLTCFFCKSHCSLYKCKTKCKFSVQSYCKTVKRMAQKMLDLL